MRERHRVAEQKDRKKEEAEQTQLAEERGEGASKDGNGRKEE